MDNGATESKPLQGEAKAHSPVEIRRCQHIKTSGAQCGSPALKDEGLCYYHSESRPERVSVKGADGQTSEILLPAFEDAAALQMTVRQVAILLLQDRIDSKKASQMLYALQIASSNLKQMHEEKPRPAQVVVDVQKVGETPVGMTPWSFHESGHEPEQLPDVRIARTKREILEEQEHEEELEEMDWMKDQLDCMDNFMEGQEADIQGWLNSNGEWRQDWVRWALGRVKGRLEEARRANRKGILLSDLGCCSVETGMREG